jgi:preprotein translocase subunit SecF
MLIIKYRKYFFTLSIILIALSIGAIGYFGLNLGIDFTGGTMIEVAYPDGRPDIVEIREAVAGLDLGAVSVQPTGEDGLILRLRHINEETHREIINTLTLGGEQAVEEVRFSAIGPTIGQELARKGLLALAIAILIIILYVAFAFRGGSETISSWKYGLVAVGALVHDIIIPVGIFAVLGFALGVEMDALFLTALLTIMGLSVNDTIVVFDRVRENLKQQLKIPFSEVVGKSLHETYGRSLITSLTSIFVLLTLLFLGGEVTRFFALALALGFGIGTYSSLFFAAPLLVAWERAGHRK